MPLYTSIRRGCNINVPQVEAENHDYPAVMLLEDGEPLHAFGSHEQPMHNSENRVVNNRQQSSINDFVISCLIM